MKRLIYLFCLFLLLTPTSSRAEEPKFNKEQLQLRTDIFNFLKEEGFMPEIDSDGDIKFKSEGHTTYVEISKTDENPMYVKLSRFFSYPEDVTAETLEMATKELNRYKGIKVTCFESSYSIRAEMFVRDSNAFNSVFYKLNGLIYSCSADVLDECKKVSSSSTLSISEIPFIITKMEVANVKQDGTIIQDYGSTIYDYKTNYLQPRITIKPFMTGKYTVQVKLWKDNSLCTGSSSKNDCSYTYDITIDGKQSQVITVSGWGSDRNGHWSMGTYRFEIWYNGYCLGSKTFKVI